MLEAKGGAPKPGDPAVRPTVSDTIGSAGRPRIRCPRCGWQPRAEDRWQCTCLHVWNTFDTRGRCPACAFQWTETMCPSCARFSPHEDWYEKAGSER